MVAMSNVASAVLLAVAARPILYGHDGVARWRGGDWPPAVARSLTQRSDAYVWLKGSPPPAARAADRPAQSSRRISMLVFSDD
jgi:hypothetical protein